MNEYNSIEEFIFMNKRYPNLAESRLLYDMLWDKYIKDLNEKDKKIAIENDKMQNYENVSASEQKEIIEKIAKSTERLKGLLQDKKTIISVYYGERWGIYSIYIAVNCLSKQKLYKFRNGIPNFFEGWEIKLVSASLLQKIFCLFARNKLWTWI